jgi:hypothetical protein
MIYINESIIYVELNTNHTNKPKYYNDDEIFNSI